MIMGLLTSQDPNHGIVFPIRYLSTYLQSIVTKIQLYGVSSTLKMEYRHG